MKKTCWKKSATAFLLGLMGLLAAGATVLDARSAGAQPRGPTRVAERITRSQSHPLGPALRIARSSQQELMAVKDYRAIFTKKEFLDGRLQTESMQIKLRERPFSVYLRFGDLHAGREVIYPDKQNGGKLLAHEAGIKSLVGTVSLLPTSAGAMEGNRYPITMIGMRNLLDKVIEQWEMESKHGDVEVKYFPSASIGNLPCNVIQTSHPRSDSRYKFHMTRLYLNKKTNLPVRVEQFAFPASMDAEPPMVEQYTYTNVKTNVGLTNIDFDTSNPRYEF